MNDQSSFLSPYPSPRRASSATAATATFTIDAGGVQKTVSAYGLGMQSDGPDAVILRRLAELSELLGSFEPQVAADQGVSAEPYQPQSYRAWLCWWRANA